LRLHDKIRKNLITKDFKKFNDFLKKNYRVYALEFPIRTNDGTKYVDLILENQDDNSLSVVEFKSDFVDFGTVEQITRYIDVTNKQLYRKKDNIQGLIVGPAFSDFEIQMCKKAKIVPLQYEHEKGNLRIAI
jgi:RecB family endonuclease NucS